MTALSAGAAPFTPSSRPCLARLPGVPAHSGPGRACRQYRWLLTDRQSRQQLVRSAMAYRPSVAPAVSNPMEARRTSVAPTFSTHGASQAFSRAKIRTLILHGDGRAESSSLRIDHLATGRSSCQVIETGASPRWHGMLRPYFIHAHSSNRGSAVLAPHSKEMLHNI